MAETETPTRPGQQQKTFKQRRSFGKIPVSCDNRRATRNVLKRVEWFLWVIGFVSRNIFSSASRSDEVSSIRAKFPQKVPVSEENEILAAYQFAG